MLKFYNDFNGEGMYNMTDLYYWNVKKKIDKIKNNRKYKKVFIINNNKYDIQQIYDIIYIFNHFENFNNIINHERFDKLQNWKVTNYVIILDFINKIIEYINKYNIKIEAINIAFLNDILHQITTNTIDTILSYSEFTRIFKIVHNIIKDL